MDPMKIIDLKKSVLENNDEDADRLRVQLREKKIFYVNVMSSPGAGKTSTILRTIEVLKGKLNIGVMEADIDSSVDTEKIARQAKVPAIQLHTGGMCHLDADMSRQGLSELGALERGLNLVILENVGNLVCPAEFDTGSSLNICILSVPEGSDKPLKYPLMFEKCQAVLINKIDTMPVFDFSMNEVTKNIHMRNPGSEIFAISAKTGEGIGEWCDWLYKQARQWLQ